MLTSCGDHREQALKFKQRSIQCRLGVLKSKAVVLGEFL